ncbi:glycosyltransferase family 4 protein [Halomonas denitrificans]|uniref:glycosyltransferase family 4 protein n=1 Tax=Halomonas denitrificans TaxID=370769 RepID=UPI001C99BA51|nr:glycosyltransferase family 4 protein [Halomonas denitrificans]MBY5969544.1 glycosyltransferase family 4 protein [Halomonas denitrificans]
MSKTIWLVNQYASTPEYGYAGRLYYLGKELSQRGYNVYLITSANHHLLREKPVIRSKYWVEKQSDSFNVVWCKMPAYNGAHSRVRVLGWFLFAITVRLLLSKLRHSPDVVLCSSPSLVSFLGARSVAMKARAKLILDVRDIWPLTLTQVGGFSTRNLFIRFLQKIEDSAYQRSDWVISNLQGAVSHMKMRGMDEKKFIWIANGISVPEVANPLPLDINIANKIPKDKFVIGYTGTVGTANAMDSLIVAAELLKNFSDIAFVIIGNGKELESLKSLALEKGLSNIIFAGSIPKCQVQSALAHFDVCFIGWRDEPLYRFGIGANKIPEYLYSGTPILHAYSGQSDPVQNALAGITVAAGDPEAIAQAVLQFKNMCERERLSMGSNGREYALKFYDYSTLAGILERKTLGDIGR